MVCRLFAGSQKKLLQTAVAIAENGAQVSNQKASGFQVPAVTVESRKSMLPVAKQQTSKGNKSASEAEKRRLQGLPLPLVMVGLQRLHIHL